jgi:hypothetical protein
MVEKIAQEPWPVWARLLLALTFVLVFLTLIPWLYMGVAMAAGCGPMMGGMHMIDTPMMR